MKNITIYSTINEQGVIRMAAHKMSSAPPVGNYDIHGWCPFPIFNFRVLWSFGDDRYVYCRSCRGINSFRHAAYGYKNHFRTDDAAIRWLVEPEVEP